MTLASVRCPPVPADFPRVQIISSYLARKLRRAKEAHAKSGRKSDWIFPSATRRNAHRTTVAKSFRRCVISAKLDPQKIKPYTLRRTSITDVADTKIDVAGLMEISGHKSVEMVLRYVHTRKERIRRSMRALEVH